MIDRTWALLAEAAARGEWVALATVIGVNGSAPRSSGARMLVWADGRAHGTVGGGNFEKVVLEGAALALAERKPRRLAVHLTRDLGMCCGGAMEVFIEPIPPTETLLVFGAGHVARPTASFAREAGWNVRVIDAREDWATVERFPGCTVEVAEPRAVARATASSPLTYALVVTHDHALDQDLVEILLGVDLAYLGLIGSRAKVAKFLLRLRAAGVDPARFARLSAPVGLDLGAETPAEIAVAIVAELVARRRGVTVPTLARPENRPAGR